VSTERLSIPYCPASGRMLRMKELQQIQTAIPITGSLKESVYVKIDINNFCTGKVFKYSTEE